MCTVVDEAAVVELLSFFPARDAGDPLRTGRGERPDTRNDASTAERLTRIDERLTSIDERLTSIEARIDVLATDMRAGLAAIEQRILEREP